MTVRVDWMLPWRLMQPGFLVAGWWPLRKRARRRNCMHTYKSVWSFRACGKDDLVITMPA